MPKKRNQFKCLILPMLAVGLFFLSGCIKEKKMESEYLSEDSIDESVQGKPEDFQEFGDNTPIDFSSITLFQNVVAGDYLLFQILGNGGIEIFHWNRINQLLNYQKSVLSKNQLENLGSLITHPDFRGLEASYDVYPLPEESTLQYEDIYYLVRVHYINGEKSVLAHEGVIPADLSLLVEMIKSFAEEIPEEETSGGYLFAGEHELIGYKRYTSAENQLVIRRDDLKDYPVIIDLLDRPYSLFSNPDIDDSKKGYLPSSDITSLQVVLPDQSWDILYLSGGGSGLE